jgi:hypothetical protein
MRAVALAIAAFLLAASQGRAAEPCRFLVLTQVGFYADLSGTRNDSRVDCFDEYTNPYPGVFSAKTWIVDVSESRTIAEDECRNAHNHPECAQQVWIGVANGSTILNHCYRSRISAFSTFYVNETGSAQQCVSGTSDCADCNLINDGPGANCPIILNPSNGPWRLAGLDQAVEFDLDGDGHTERLGWTAADSSLAFLVRDLNGNGAIDDGKELFGIGTRLPTGERAENGFTALRQEDANADGVINKDDPAWRTLLLWTDLNHDGQSKRDELRPISMSDITALEVGFHEVGRRDTYGNLLRYQAFAHLNEERRPFYDVFFVRRQ